MPSTRNLPAVVRERRRIVLRSVLVQIKSWLGVLPASHVGRGHANAVIGYPEGPVIVLVPTSPHACLISMFEFQVEPRMAV